MCIYIHQYVISSLRELTKMVKIGTWRIKTSLQNMFRLVCHAHQLWSTMFHVFDFCLQILNYNCFSCILILIKSAFMQVVVVVLWLSSWLAMQGVRGSIPVSLLWFQRLVISCFQVTILLKLKCSKQPTSQSLKCSNFPWTLLGSIHNAFRFIVELVKSDLDLWLLTPKCKGIFLSRSCIYALINKKPLKTVWPDCKAATKFERIDWEQA